MASLRYAAHPNDRDLVDQIRQALWVLLKRRDLPAEDFVEIARLTAALDHFPDVLTGLAVALELNSNQPNRSHWVRFLLDDSGLSLERGQGQGADEEGSITSLSISRTDRDTDGGEDDSFDDPVETWLDDFLVLIRGDSTSIHAFDFGEPAALANVQEPRETRWAGIVDPETGEGFPDETDEDLEEEGDDE